MSQSNRIEYIDLAKGICILLVVLLHCNVPSLRALSIMRMPLYFVLSGLFFKDYGGPIAFIIKKTNRLLIPFATILLPALALRQLLIGDINFLHIYYWIGHTPSTLSLWFLFVLFQSSVLYALLHHLFKHPLALLAACLTVGFIGYITSTHYNLSGFLLNRSFLAVPLLYVGHKVRYLSIFHASRWDKLLLPLSITTFISFILLAEYYDLHLIMLENHYQGHPFILFVAILALVLSFLLICKFIKHIPLISYIGRYSIVVLCVHGLFLEILHHEAVHTLLHMDSFSPLTQGIITFVITFIGSTLCIHPCITYLPKLFAQKDLFTYAQLRTLLAK